MRILIVEDDRASANTLKLLLEAAGCVVYHTDLGEEGVDLAKNYEYDLITLDADLPDMSGFDVLRDIRVARVKTPVLMLTARAEVADKSRAFELGADDYLTKPYHRDELLGRVRAIVRRSRGIPSPVVKVGNMEIDLAERTASIGRHRIPLTGKEWGMLELLTLRRGSTLTKEMFLNHLYGGMDEPELKIIDVFICKLRKKLKDAGVDTPIQTIWGRGYVLAKGTAAA
jgi:two-component system cell cycle response regulator CtrA